MQRMTASNKMKKLTACCVHPPLWADLYTLGQTGVIIEFQVVTEEHSGAFVDTHVKDTVVKENARLQGIVAAGKRSVRLGQDSTELVVPIPFLELGAAFRTAPFTVVIAKSVFIFTFPTLGKLNHRGENGI